MTLKLQEVCRAHENYERLKLFAAQVPQVQQCCGEMWMGKMCIWSPWRPKSWRPSTHRHVDVLGLNSSCKAVQRQIFAVSELLWWRSALRLAFTASFKSQEYSHADHAVEGPSSKRRVSRAFFPPNVHPMSTQCSPSWDKFRDFEDFSACSDEKFDSCRFAVSGSMWCWAPSLDVSFGAKLHWYQLKLKNKCCEESNWVFFWDSTPRIATV